MRSPPITIAKEKIATWAALMARIAIARKRLYFSERLRFDQELRPKISHGNIILYPDAIYLVTEEDFERAWSSVSEDPLP